MAPFPVHALLHGLVASSSVYAHSTQQYVYTLCTAGGNAVPAAAGRCRDEEVGVWRHQHLASSWCGLSPAPGVCMAGRRAAITVLPVMRRFLPLSYKQRQGRACAVVLRLFYCCTGVDV